MMNAVRAPSSAAGCSAWQSSLASLRRLRSLTSSHRPRMAVCLTGQLRLFMVSFPSLAAHILLAAAESHRLDLFYVGPADLSFNRSAEWLHQISGLRGATVYEPALRWLDEPGRGPIAQARRGHCQRARTHLPPRPSPPSTPVTHPAAACGPWRL